MAQLSHHSQPSPGPPPLPPCSPVVFYFEHILTQRITYLLDFPVRAVVISLIFGGPTTDPAGQIVLHAVTVRRHRADDDANDDTWDADNQEGERYRARKERGRGKAL